MIAYNSVSFFRRLYSYILDSIFFIALLVPLGFLKKSSINFDIHLFGFNFTLIDILGEILLSILWITVWIKFKGKSPAQYFLFTRIVSYPSLEDISRKQAIIRYFTLIIYLLFLAGFLNMLLFSLVFLPIFFKYWYAYVIMTGLFIFSISLFFIKTKRPIHDIIAKTCMIDERINH
jgi:hypothetical protein